MNLHRRQFRRLTVLGSAVVLFLSLPVHARAGAPTDQLRDGVDRVFAIVRDPALKGEGKAGQRRAAIIKVSQELFDFGEMAKRSLGQHWDKRTPTERSEFVRLYTDLIQRSYVTKVDQHGSATLVIKGETVDNDRAVVQTTLPLDHGREMPLDYRMHATNDRWRVYDISIDGISLVANYRAQFNKIIRTSSYDALVTKLRSNEAEFAAPSAAVSGEKAAR